jgi:hypothetical protein
MNTAMRRAREGEMASRWHRDESTQGRVTTQKQRKHRQLPCLRRQGRTVRGLKPCPATVPMLPRRHQFGHDQRLCSLIMADAQDLNNGLTSCDGKRRVSSTVLDFKACCTCHVLLTTSISILLTRTSTHMRGDTFTTSLLFAEGIPVEEGHTLHALLVAERIRTGLSWKSSLRQEHPQ